MKWRAGLLGNVRFRRTFWEAFEDESWGVGSDALSAGDSSVVGGGAEQGIGGIEPGSLAGRDERKPGGVAWERWHAGQ